MDNYQFLLLTLHHLFSLIKQRESFLRFGNWIIFYIGREWKKKWRLIQWEYRVELSSFIAQMTDLMVHLEFLQRSLFSFLSFFSNSFRNDHKTITNIFFISRKTDRYWRMREHLRLITTQPPPSPPTDMKLSSGCFTDHITHHLWINLRTLWHINKVELNIHIRKTL